MRLLDHTTNCTLVINKILHNETAAWKVINKRNDTKIISWFIALFLLQPKIYAHSMLNINDIFLVWYGIIRIIGINWLHWHLKAIFVGYWLIREGWGGGGGCYCMGGSNWCDESTWSALHVVLHYVIELFCLCIFFLLVNWCHETRTGQLRTFWTILFGWISG